MTAGEIAELFIQAAEIEQRLPPAGERPARLKAQAFAYVHDVADMNGWSPPHKKDAKIGHMIQRKRETGDQLEIGDSGRLDQEAIDFWDGKSSKIQPKDVTHWESCMMLITRVKRERDRRCLWNWAKSKAKGLSFSKWCRNVEHIHRNYGIECTNRALAEISASIQSKPLQHNGFGRLTTLQPCTQIGQFMDTIADDVNDDKQPTFWRPNSSKPLEFDETLQDFSYYEARKEQRRQRELRKQAA